MHRYTSKLMCTLAMLFCLSLIARAQTVSEEFVGPFPSWANVKTDYGAVGDGKADNTAAIQKGLEDIRREASPKRVLYFPAGTYRITSTLQQERLSHSEPLGTSIIGEDPEKTIIKWDGPAGVNMFRYNAWYASMQRLTFDGMGKAKTAIEHGAGFTTANEFTDIIIKDVQYGIEAGLKDGIAETAVLRCRFYRCAKIAISIQNFNTLDWYIWHCWFEDCGIGVSNERDAGNFHIMKSTFLRSTEADITITNTGYFSFVGNLSVGSRAFFHAKRAPIWKATETWGSQCTLQDNTILDPLDPAPIHIENNGPNLLLDNVVRLKGAGPVVLNEPPSEVADLISVGNRWTAAKAVQVKGRLTELDDTVVKAGAIKTIRPAPEPFAVHVARPIIEVPVGADASVIQRAIDQAASMHGERPVVHLPKGSYNIGKTLLIPPNCDLQLVGDGVENATMLSGGGANPLIRVSGPSHATFRNFWLRAGNDAVAIQLENCDQPGGRIFGEELNMNGYEYGLVSQGLKNTRIELHDAGHDGIQVIGAGPGTKPWLALLCGSSGRGSDGKAGTHLYDVQHGGRLFVRDIWYEGNAYSMFNLTDSGEFAYHSGFMAPYDPNHGQQLEWEKELRQSTKSLQIDGFRGKVALTLISVSNGDFCVKAPSSDTKLYLMGFMTNKNIELGSADVKGTVVADHMRMFRTNATGLDAIDGKGTATPEFIREMLQPLREVKAQLLTPLKDDVTDVRFYRVWTNGKNGVCIQADKE